MFSPSWEFHTWAGSSRGLTECQPPSLTWPAVAYTAVYTFLNNLCKRSLITFAHGGGGGGVEVQAGSEALPMLCCLLTQCFPHRGSGSEGESSAMANRSWDRAVNRGKNK